MTDIHRRKLVLSATGALLLHGHAHSQPAFPTQPIKILVPFPPGSSVDLIARALGPLVSEELGQPVVIENKVGAQGALAAREVARARKDGYTLLMGTNSTHAANVYMINNLGYRPIEDFTPITQITINPLMLAVNGELPVNDINDLVKLLNDMPGSLNYGVANSGSLVAAQLLKSLTGVQAEPVNYPGSVQALTDLMAGRIHFLFTDPNVLLPFAADKRLKILGLTSKQMLVATPQIRPIAELGMPAYDYSSWVSLFGPAGIPPENVSKLNKAFNKAINNEKITTMLSKSGVIPAASTPAQLGDFVKTQVTLWGKLTKEAGVKPL